MFGIKIKLENDEEIELKKAANHFKGIEGVGGRIFITNKRVVFKSHKINIQNHELTINFEEIERVQFYNTMGLVPNGLEIITKSGKKEKFVVWKRNKIKRLIEAKC